ncbi:MAG: S8 family serine peptidase [Oscillospiraceae bacterium]
MVPLLYVRRSDQTLYTGHPEYSDQHEEIHVLPVESANIHGSVVSSIAVGKSCGVAPGAKLYYWAINSSKVINSISSDDASIAFADGLAVAIDRVLEINKSLPGNEKIRVISISRGFSILEDESVKTFLAAVQRAKKAGVFVVTTSTYQCYDWLNEENDFAGLGKVDFTGDPDKLSTYTLGTWEQSIADKCISKLLAPMDVRTTADFTSGDGYVFYSDGGWSWVAPYLAGVYALACQVKPDVTPEEFWNAALETADTLTVKIQTENTSEGEEYAFQHVINPVHLIESLEDGK